MSEQGLDIVSLVDAMLELKALKSLMAILNEDVERFRNTTDSAGRRALVRAVFAYLEGSSFGLRSAAFYLARVRKMQLNVGEMMMARETVYALNDKGEVEEKQMFSSPLANIRFALKLFAKVAGATYEFPAGDSNFERLRKAQHVRNRLTHPRSSKDLEITAEEQTMVIKAGDWIVEQQSKVMGTFLFRLVTGWQDACRKTKVLPKIESGGHSALTVENIFAEVWTSSEPILPEKVEEWFASLPKSPEKLEEWVASVFKGRAKPKEG